MSEFPKTMARFVRDGLIDQLSTANLQVLDDLRAQGKSVMVLTSRGHGEVKHLLKPKHVLYARIAAFYYRDNLEFTKPDPRIFDLILSTHKLKPQECVYVGDTLVDAQCAKSRGLKFIASLESELQRKQDFDGIQVDALIKKLPEAIDALNAINTAEVPTKVSEQAPAENVSESEDHGVAAAPKGAKKIYSVGMSSAGVAEIRMIK